MKTYLKVLIVTLVFAIPALLIGKNIWPPSPDLTVPTSGQLPFFILLAVIEAVTFGLGIAFIIFSWPPVKSLHLRSRKLEVANFVSIAWLLVSWWPHDNFHIHNGLDLQGLLYIDYGFHVTLIIASLFVAYSFFIHRGIHLER